LDEAYEHKKKSKEEVDVSHASPKREKLDGTLELKYKKRMVIRRK